LRELATRDSMAVSKFLAAHDHELAARVKREVRNKLTTGLKAPGSIKRSKRRAGSEASR
jgi:hypothetical protein